MDHVKRENAEIAVKDLIPYVNNSRTHSDMQVNQIAASITEFGFTNPVLVDDKNNVIAGHGRILAAEKLSMDTVPCVVLTGLSEAQQKALVIADNKLALNAGWNYDVLANEINNLLDMDFDIDVMGFSDEELAALLETEVEGETDPDSIPAEPEFPRAELGDIWLLGNHKVICGDATILTEYEKLFGDVRCDLYLTDPPYNVNYEGKTKDALKIENDKMDADAFRLFLSDSFTNASAFMKDGAPFYIWHADMEGYNFRGACMDSGLSVRQNLIWNKNSMVLGRQDYQWKHEPCLYGWKEGAKHTWYSDRKQVTVLDFDRPTANKDHPTMKPVNLLEYQVRNSTKTGDVVLDTFAGSGSTLIACEKSGRTCYAMELDPKYVDVIIQRWQEFTGQEAIHAETGEVFNVKEEAA